MSAAQSSLQRYEALPARAWSAAAWVITARWTGRRGSRWNRPSGQRSPCSESTITRREYASVRSVVRCWSSVIFDCQSCGACCCNTDENRAEDFADYVLVGARSPLTRHPSLLRKLTVLNQKGERHMRLKGAEQRCAALTGELGVRVSCTIYQLRPAGSRRVVPGSKECRRDQR